MSSNSINTQKITGKDLSDLYPVPKSYREMKKERDAAQAYRSSLRPKYTLITAGLTLTGVLVFVMHALSVFDWTTSIIGVFSGVFFFALITLAIFGITWWQCVRLASYFEDRGLASGWFIYLHGFLAAAALWFSTLILLPDSLKTLLVSGLYFVTMLCIGLVYVAINSKR